MATANRITRRRFLGWSAIVSAPFAGLWNIVIQTPTRSSLDSQLKQFAAHLVRAMFRDSSSAARLGTAYMRDVPTECDLAYLLNALSAENPSLEGIVTRNEEDNLRIALHQTIKRDFEYGDVVSIGGWVVARTEARLSALASLV